MMTLNLVMLFSRVSLPPKNYDIGCRAARPDVYIQLTPDQRRINRLIIRVRIQYLIRITVESLIAPILPQACPVGIRVGDAEEGEGGDDERDFEDEEAEHDFVRAPAVGDVDAPSWCHAVCLRPCERG